MSSLSSLELLKEAVAECTSVDPEKVTPVATMLDLGIDSLELTEVIFMLEDKLDVNLDSADSSLKTKLPETVAAVLQLLDAAVANKTQGA